MLACSIIQTLSFLSWGFKDTELSVVLKNSVCSSGILSAIPKSPGPWLILCACLLWQPAFPQPGADSIHFLFLCSVAQSIVTLKGLEEQDQSSQSSCLTKSPPLPYCLCSSTKSLVFGSTFKAALIPVSRNGKLDNEKCQERNVKCHYLTLCYAFLMLSCSLLSYVIGIGVN